MTLVAFLIISASVFLHAGWNFISKKNNKDSEISYIYRNPFDYLVDATNNMIIL